MGWNSWMKLGKPKATPKTAPKKPKGKTGEPPSWMAEKWNKAKGATGTALSLGTGVALGSMIPFAASKATERDIERMRGEAAGGRH